MADIDPDYVVVDNLNVGEPSETVAEIKDWLCPTDSDSPASEYQKHIHSYVPGTGEWILETDQYCRWLKADDRGALWIRGIPGSGKSVVAARFIQRLQAQGECPVLFFFFREIIMSNRTPRSLCQDLACGLLPHSPQLQTCLKSLKERHHSVDAAPFEELWKYLSSALAATSRVFCVVDALDEMEPGHEDFIRSLIDLANRHPASIKLVLTSRQLLYLEERFRGTSGLIDLRLDRRHVDQDIERYIEHRLSTHQPPIKPEEAASIKTSICEKGRGLFLYARLMMDELLSHPEDITSQLVQLPDGLGDMYTDILREHAERSGTTLSFQRLVLQWITHSARPLRLLELATAIDSLPDRGGLCQDQDAKVAVRTACGPLLELCEDGVIQIIHHSLTEFFRDPNISHVRRTEGTSGDTPVLDSTKAHAHIARTCINYLLSGDFDVNLPSGALGQQYNIKLKEKMQQFPLLQYSALYWPVHAAEADSSDEELLAIIDSLLRHNPVKFDTWKDYYRASRGGLIASSSALHVAAFAGLRRYVERIVSDMDVDITDEWDKTPLAYAAKAGHADIATLLLQHGAHHGAVDKNGMAPVHHAANENRPRAMRALLEGGADPMLPKSKDDSYYGPIGRTALFYACRYGHLEVLEELQRKLNVEHLRHGPLHWAAAAGKSKILSALLQDPEVRLSINDRDADGNTPLYLAAYAREPDTVEVLLEHGADPNAVSEDKRNPAMFSKRSRLRRLKAATRGRSAPSRPFYSPLHGWAHLSEVHAPHGSIHNMHRVADLLARAGADVNDRNHEGRTALFAIEHLPREEEEFGRAMVSVLLAHGADATVTDFDGNTPLHVLQVIPVDLELVRLLVHAGVDINAARKTDGKTFIMERDDLFAYMDLEPFHELNVDFDRQDADGNTAAHLAAASIARLLVERWVDMANPEIQNQAGETALHRLVKRGQHEPSVIQRMLDKGFSLESRDYRGHTMLLAFLAKPWARSFYDTVKVLLDLGANAQATDYEGKSALHLVAETEVSYVNSGAVDVENKLKVMRLLIAAGVNVNSVDHSGNTILHASIAWKEEWYCAQSSAWAALELGVEPGRQNHRGRTILHMAATIDMHRKSRQSEKRGASSLMTFVLDPQRGLDVNAPDYEGITPLHLAASKAERNSWMLIQAGANIQSRTHSGETPLHFAARAGQANIVGLMLDLYQKQSLAVDSPSLSGRTALHEAARSGRPESVKLLLDAGADPHKFDRDGRGPLHAAAEFVEMNRSLDKPGKCKCGSDCSKPNCRRDVFGADRNALHFMGLVVQDEDGARNIREVVRLLLGAGADPAHLDNSEFTATDVALMFGASAVVDELRAAMGVAYRDPAHVGSLLPIDSLGESLCSLISQNISAVVAAVQVPEDSHTFLERAMSTKNELLVEELVRSRGLRLMREDGITPLRLAARWGLTSMMRRLIPYAGDLEPCYASLIAEAAKRALPNLDMIKLLTQYRGSQESFRSSVDEPMRIFAKGEHWWHPAALTYLLDCGADPNTKGAKGETPLHCALSAGESEHSLGELWPEQTLKVLLAYKADINVVSSAGLAPIGAAIKSKKSPAVLKMLLDHGADLSLGKEPVICSAIDGSNIPATEILLQAGVDPNTRLETPAEKMPSKEFGVQTILERAACPGWENIVPAREKIMSLLLEHGADPYLPLENGRSTPFHEISGRNGIVNPIIQAGYDMEQRDINGRTPLIKACKLASDRGQRSLDEEHTAIDLVAGGADVHAKDNDGLTPLHYAAYCKLGRTVQTLLEHSASVTAKDNRGRTPLYYAFIPREDRREYPCGDIKVDMINDLLDAGADPLERGPCGRTALHLIAPSLMQYSYTGRRPEEGKMLDDGAVRSGDIYGAYAKLYRRFVDAGCDRNARDDKGNTPVFAYVATEKWYQEDVETPYPPTREEMTAMFTDHDIFVANDAGDTLLHVVARRNDDDSFIQDAPAIFSTLAGLGLDPLAENKDGQSALDAAHAWNQEEILAMYARKDE